MQTRSILGIKVILQMVTIVAVVGCAAQAKHLTTLPPASAEAGRTVVLFRVTVVEDGKPVQAMLSTSPRWTWHYRVNVGPTSQSLDIHRSFPSGQLDAASMDAGWGFLTLAPGAYQLALDAYRTSFTMRGAQRAALGFGESPAALLEVPVDASLIYVGTFAFTCEHATRWWFYEDHVCSELAIRDDTELAHEVASTSLMRFGAMRTTPASLQ